MMRKNALYGLAGALVLVGSIAGFSPPRLERTYHLRLTSAWPLWQGAPSGCADGGNETVEGVLVRTGAQSYAGTFARRTRLLFCGGHGADSGDCELTLEGKGEVAMTAQVTLDESSPSGHSARLAWVPVDGHAASVTGACPESFKREMKRMYLTVRHGAEVPLPAAGAAPIERRLENYAYVAEIE
jgi:hypothetical protein